MQFGACGAFVVGFGRVGYSAHVAFAVLVVNRGAFAEDC